MWKRSASIRLDQISTVCVNEDGQAAGFSYTDANMSKGTMWGGYLREHVGNAKKVLPGNKNDGMKKGERADLIVYLKKATNEKHHCLIYYVTDVSWLLIGTVS